MTDPARLLAIDPARRAAGPPPAPGLRPLGDGGGVLRVPVRLADPAPLLVLLHGAGSTGQAMLGLLPVNDMLVLAPDSRSATWDVIAARAYGPDVARLGSLLAAVHARWPIDPCHTVLAGFSDGASYALSLGLTNGDRFSHLVALSPGFMAPAAPRGRPPVFVSHGRADAVLPIDRCSRRLVPALRRAGHEVHYLEFDGAHAVPAGVAQEALAWVARTPSRAEAAPDAT